MLLQVRGNAETLSSIATTLPQILGCPSPFIIHITIMQRLTGYLGGKCDEENYLDFNLSVSTLSPPQQVLSLKSVGENISIYKELEINKYIPIAPNSVNNATIHILGTGAPPSLINGNFAVHYRYAREALFAEG